MDSLSTSAPGVQVLSNIVEHRVGSGGGGLKVDISDLSHEMCHGCCIVTTVSKEVDTGNGNSGLRVDVVVLADTAVALKHASVSAKPPRE